MGSPEGDARPKRSNGLNRVTVLLTKLASGSFRHRYRPIAIRSDGRRAGIQD